MKDCLKAADDAKLEATAHGIFTDELIENLRNQIASMEIEAKLNFAREADFHDMKIIAEKSKFARKEMAEELKILQAEHDQLTAVATEQSLLLDERNLTVKQLEKVRRDCRREKSALSEKINTLEEVTLKTKEECDKSVSDKVAELLSAQAKIAEYQFQIETVPQCNCSFDRVNELTLQIAIKDEVIGNLSARHLSELKREKGVIDEHFKQIRIANESAEEVLASMLKELEETTLENTQLIGKLSTERAENSKGIVEMERLPDICHAEKLSYQLVISQLQDQVEVLSYASEVKDEQISDLLEQLATRPVGGDSPDTQAVEDMAWDHMNFLEPAEEEQIVQAQKLEPKVKGKRKKGKNSAPATTHAGFFSHGVGDRPEKIDQKSDWEDMQGRGETLFAPPYQPRK